MINYDGQSVGLVSEVPPQARGWRNDKNIWKWCRQNSLISEADHAAWLNRISSDPTIKMFGIALINELFIGVCGLTSIDNINQKAEFSLYIAPEKQRLGYGKSALYTLLRHGFEDLNLNCIWGECFDGNPAIDMFKELGMTVEGTLRQRYFREGHFIDTHIVSILRGDFVK